jgi:ABC-type bacteriocin/lantibiotic exporter with double-glycine peptidase domain
MRVDVDRVNLILSLNDRELEKYGNINKQNEGYNLGFVDVTCNPTKWESSFIKNADISFNMGAINLIKGEKGSGKRAIFDLLRRYRKPNNGLIMLDNLNLYYYNEKTFKNHINYCSSHPEFINGTIRENLKLVKKNMNKIRLYCHALGLMKYIQKLPKGFDTEISDIKDSAMLFMLGLVRAALSDCNILMIYELPQDVNEKFKQNIKKLLTQQEIRKTVILFSHSDDYDDISETIYEVDNGVVKLVK